MKIIILSILCVNIAFGNCNSTYKNKSQEIEKKYKINANTATSMSTTGLGLMSLHATLSPFAPLSALSTTTTLGQVYLYGALISTSFSASEYILKRDLDWMQKVLTQSEIGFGKEINGLASDLSKEIKRSISAEEISWLIDEANNHDHFCPKNNTLMIKKQFKKYIKDLIMPLKKYDTPITRRELRIFQRMRLGL